jgi:hypothetical protein
MNSCNDYCALFSQASLRKQGAVVKESNPEKKTALEQELLSDLIIYGLSTGNYLKTDHSASDHLGDLKGNLQTLFGVEAGITGGQVVIGKLGINDIAGAAGTLGHILSGHLQMDAAGDGALGPVDLKKAGDLGEDIVEVPGLVA